MRALIAARHSPTGPKPIGGVQSWCATVGGVLERRGWDVVYWEPGRRLDGLFDIGIASNYADTMPVLKLCKKYIVVCHGIIPPEQPPAKNVVFTSEELRDHWRVEGDVVRQPIDLDFWSPVTLPKIFLTRFSYRFGLSFVPSIAKDMKLKFVHVNDATKVTARGILRRSACVLASGRAALEAMACGVPVVICDHRRSYQGPLMITDVAAAMAQNYSGRGGIEPDEQNVRRAIDSAIILGSLRAHVEQHHDADKIVDELLEAM